MARFYAPKNFMCEYCSSFVDDIGHFSLNIFKLHREQFLHRIQMLRQPSFQAPEVAALVQPFLDTTNATMPITRIPPGREGERLSCKNGKIIKGNAILLNTKLYIFIVLNFHHCIQIILSCAVHNAKVICSLFNPRG